jgi:hypothetical protein
MHSLILSSAMRDAKIEHFNAAKGPPGKRACAAYEATSTL